MDLVLSNLKRPIHYLIDLSSKQLGNGDLVS